MAIYSLHHSPVGKSTQAQPYTASAHIGYITRRRALSRMDKARLPGNSPREIASYLRECEDVDRKNARVIDKVMLALPKELDSAQRAQLVRDFAEHVTKGKAPWLAAFHDKGKDTHNPHCHLVIRDRDPKTGKRVIGTSEVGSTERLRRQWERFANNALHKAGRSERIDRRSLKAQGIQREPTVHEGPQAQAMDKRGVPAKSSKRRVRNRPGSRDNYRDVDYRSIDRGQSRPQLNRARRAGSQETEKDYWAAIDDDNQAREIDALRAIHRPDLVDVRPPPRLGRKQVKHDRVEAPLPGLPIEPVAFSPGLTPRLDARKPSFKPAAKGVARGKGQNKLANTLGPRPFTRGAGRSGTGNFAHNQSVNRPSRFVKGRAMIDDEELRNRKAKDVTDAKHAADRDKAHYDNLMERSYLDPSAAEKKMDAYSARHGNAGDAALHEKLSKNARKTAFGRRPGSLLSTDGYTQGASGRRQDSQIARQSLPEAVAKRNASRDQLAAAQRAASPESFSQKLRSKAAEPGRDEKSLKQLASEREKDKERGR